MATSQRNYFETVIFLGHQMFNDYMQGSVVPTFEGAHVVSFIFGVQPETLAADVRREFTRLWEVKSLGQPLPLTPRRNRRRNDNIQTIQEVPNARSRIV